MIPRRRPNGTRVLWRQGPVALFAFAHFSHHLSTALLEPLLPWIRSAFQLDYTRSGILVSAFSLIFGAMQPPIGVLADRVGKRSLMAFGGLAGVAVASLVVATSTGYYQVLAALVLMGILGSAYHPLAGSFISQYVPSAQRGQAYGIHLVGGNLGFLIAPVVGGAIAQTLGWRAAYASLPLTGLLAAWLFWRMTGRERGLEATAPSSKRILDTSWLGLVRPIIAIVSVSIFIHMMDAPIRSFLPLFIVDKHGVERVVAAFTVAIIHAAGVFGAPVGGTLSDRMGRKPVILLSIAATGPCMYLLTRVPFGFWLFTAAALLGLARSLRNPVVESLIADNIPAERRATAFGLYFFLTAEVGGLAVPLAGYAGDRFGLDVVFLGLATIVSSAALLALLFRKQL